MFCNSQDTDCISSAYGVSLLLKDESLISSLEQVRAVLNVPLTDEFHFLSSGRSIKHLRCGLHPFAWPQATSA